MGTSASLVLGLPIGVLLGNLFQWRTPFILIAILTILLMIGVFLYMVQVPPQKAIPLKEQLSTLKDNKLLFAHLTTFFFLAGHFTLYGYLTPYTKMMLNFSGMTISILYFVYGISAVSGGGIAGLAADRFGLRRVVFIVITLLAATLFIIPFSVSIVSSSEEHTSELQSRGQLVC